MAELQPGVWYTNASSNRSRISKQTCCWLWRGNARDPQGRPVQPYMEIGFKSSDGDVSLDSAWVINGGPINAPREVTHVMPAELPGPPGAYSLHDHTLALGKLVTNLLSLEAALRFFLSDTDAANGLPQASLGELLRARLGQSFELCALTDYGALGALIDRYNERVLPRAVSLKINREELVTLRDALAHGRLVSSEPAPPLTLFKFTRPLPGAATVTVAVAERLTPEWFRHHTSRIFREVQNVTEARQLFGLS